MRTLWTFINKDKLDAFLPSLVHHEIDHEVQSKNGLPYTQGEATILVDERDYEKARKLLMKHRKRRTSSDLL